MASLNFQESIVLILFAQSISKPQPTRTELVDFDASLQKDFGARLAAIMDEEGMEQDIRNRSAVMGCRPHMPGNTPAAQIRNACRFVMHGQKELGEAAIAAFRATESITPVTRTRQASGKARPRKGKSSPRGRRKRMES
jgi:hypothetical protein